MYFVVRWLISVAALLVVVHLVPGVRFDNTGAMIVAALVIGLLNSFLRPVMVLVTLPLSVLSFGLFTLIINGFIFYMASKFVYGFIVSGFWNAFWASLVYSVISFLLNTLLNPGVAFRIRSHRSGRQAAGKYDNVIDVEAVVKDSEK